MRLVRGLGFVHVFSIASGAMISSGLFVLPGLAHAMAGPGVVLSYLLAGLLATTGMLSIAELSTAMPKPGGDYFFITRGLGPAAGTISGLLTWFSLSLKSAFALTGMAAFAGEVVSGAGMHVTAAFFCLLFVLVNIVGVREAGRVQVLLVAALLSLMLLYLARGLPAVSAANFSPFAPYGFTAVLSAAGFVFVSYGGLLKIASLSGEVRSPGRTVPLGMIASLVVVSLLYTLMVFVTTGVLGADELDRSLTPISDGAAVFMGPPGRVVFSVAAILAFVSTANAGIMAASRYLLALSDDCLLPPAFGRVSRRFSTPYVAVGVTGAFIASALFLDLSVLVKAASSVLILTYILSNLTVVVLREGRVQNYQPLFRTPLYPWPQVVGTTGFVLLLVEMGTSALLISLGLIVTGFLVYWFYGRVRTDQEFALLHLVERLTARELVTGSLEAELREVIRERDEIVKDRFDGVIEMSTVLDIEEGVSRDRLFSLIAERLSEQTGTDTRELYRLFVERERESSTAIGGGIAIPHIVVPGEHVFAILLARSRQGVFFSEQAPSVRAVFVLAGTADERNFHLRALSALAQVVQTQGFEKSWRSAKGPEALRDLILLGKRRRNV